MWGGTRRPSRKGPGVSLLATRRAAVRSLYVASVDPETIEQIRARLKLVGPGPATMFADACELMRNPDALGSTSHLVAHLLREVLSSLEQVLYAVSSSRTLLPPVRASLAGPDSDLSADVRVSHATKVKAILSMLGIDAASGVGATWIDIAQNGGFSGAAHRRALDAPRRVDVQFSTDWNATLALLVSILERFQTRFLAWRRTLDELLRHAQPGRKQVSALRNEVPNNPQNLDYFFSRAGPEWLTPLVRENFFSVAPDTDVDPDGKSWRYPPWPPVNYLRRLASSAALSPTIAQAVAQIPPTDNTFTWMGVYQVALGLPPADAMPLLPYLVRAFAARALLSVPKLAADLVVRLATNGYGSETLPLCREALSLRAEHEQDEARRRAIGVLDEHELKSFLDKVTVPLADAAGAAWVSLLCDVLDLALSIGRSGQSDYDYSHIWRRSVARDDTWPDTKGSLVSAVRDASVRAAAKDVREVVKILEGRPWSIFDRLALHLLAALGEAAPIDVVEERLTDKARWDRNEHEYRVLLRESFAKCSSAGRQKILEWIDTGPGRADVQKQFEFFRDRLPTEAEVARAAKEWQLERLVPIKDDLDRSWAERYGAIVRELAVKPPVWDPTVGPYEAVLERPASPKSAAELSAMPVPELAAWLKAWQAPQTDFGSLDAEVARELSSAVTGNLAVFAQDAREFIGAPPIYVTHLLQAFAGAGVDPAVPWEPILDLCAAVAATLESDQAERWSHARSAAASLIVGLLQHDGPPSSLRPKVWKVVEYLSRDPDPAPERDSTGDRPYERGLGSVRGRAIRAAILYALWVAQHKRLDGGTPPSVAQEVRDLVAQHVDVAVDPSPAIRSIVAALLPLIVGLDADWGRTTATALFDAGVPQALRDATWAAYVLFAPGPKTTIWRMVEREYRARVAVLAGTDREKEPKREDVALGRHVVTLYAISELTLDDELVTGFFTHANDALRLRVQQWIAQSVTEDESVTPAIVHRLQSLWNARVNGAKADPSNASKELSAVGMWFATGKFESQWADRQLRDVCDLGIRVSRAASVFERLAERARTDLDVAFDLTARLVERVREEWELGVAEKQIRSVLAAALADRNLKPRAEEVVNRLAARGHGEFADLLSTPT